MRKFKGIEVDENEVEIIIFENGTIYICDKNNNVIYWENSYGECWKREIQK